MKQPYVFEIKRNSLDDGRGIRTVVFFKGCPLSCAWCHNPEAHRATDDIAWDAALCLDCGACSQACDHDAIRPDAEHRVDRDACTLCFECVEACPSGAMEQVGRQWEVDQLVAEVVKDKPFFDNSDGGVTLSGGEPVHHAAYAGELARRLHEAGVHVLVETAGHFDFARFDELLLPHVDAVFFDLKVMDPVAHRRLCGRDNALILDNFERLLERSHAGAVELLPRVPLVPGMTATGDNLSAIASFLRARNVTRIALLAYHPFWATKLRKLDRASSIPDDPRLAEFMSQAEIDDCRARFHGFEIV